VHVTVTPDDNTSSIERAVGEREEGREQMLGVDGDG
jgi:hypothetical protein